MITADPTVLVLSILLCLFIAIFFYRQKRNAHSKLPPGPSPLPIIGNLHMLDLNRPYQTLHQLSKKYGPVYTIQMGEEKVVVLCGYEAVKDALINHAEEFSGRPGVPLFDDMIKGYGIIFAYDDNWRVMRRFSLSTLRDFGMGKEFIENKIAEESDFLAQRFRSYKGEPFDNTILINAAVANIIVAILLSNRFDYEDPKFVKLLKIINESTRLVGTPMAMFAETYGSVFSLRIGPQKMVVLSGYDTVKDALINYAEEFSGRPCLPAYEDLRKGHGIILANGENWKVMRRFAMSTLRDFGMGKKTIEDKIIEECDYLTKHMCSFKGEAFQDNELLNAAVANIIVSIVLGHRFDYQDPALLRLLKLSDDNLRVAGSPMVLLYNTFPSVVRWLPGSHNSINKNAEELNRFVTKTFTNYKKKLDVNDQRNLIETFLVKQQEEKPSPDLYFNNKNLTLLVTDLFSAGMETTTTTLRWGLLLMMKYPEIQKNVHNEIDRVIGTAVPLSIHRKEMPYTDAVIHEIQRFANILPTNLPHATTQDVFFRGYFLPKGTYVIPLLASVLRDKNYFEKPEEFYPQHFLDSKGNFLKNEAFIPFSLGKRSCAGESLAKMELFLFFTTLLQKFTFQAPPGEKLQLIPAVGLTTPPVNYRICAIPRN
ncbi:cytochrome P450 2K6-like [Leptodactylus fuscus]|uniref:cytochrome P450 2K6-like n=1 Tax=Leptodactylus fuscus TaxID=238119 RepID=UPI003F4EAB01